MTISGLVTLHDQREGPRLELKPYGGRLWTTERLIVHGWVIDTEYWEDDVAQWLDRHWTKDGILQLRNSPSPFALAIVDTHTHRMWLARSLLTSIPLFWANSKGTIAYSWKASQAATLCGMPRSVNQKQLTAYILCTGDTHNPGDESFLSGIRRLKGGTAQAFTFRDPERVQAESTQELYPRPDIPMVNPPSLGHSANEQDDRSWFRQLRTLLPNVTGPGATGRLAIALSGGLDSSVLSAASVLAGKEVHAFNTRAPVPQDDEGDWATLCALSLGIPIRRVDSRNWYTEARELVEKLGEPSPYANLLDDWQLILSAAQAGIGEFAHGFGGDIIFSVIPDAALAQIAHHPKDRTGWTELLAWATRTGRPEETAAMLTETLKMCPHTHLWRLPFFLHRLLGPRAWGYLVACIWEILRDTPRKKAGLWRTWNPYLAEEPAREMAADQICIDHLTFWRGQIIAGAEGVWNLLRYGGTDWVAGLLPTLGEHLEIKVRLPYFDPRLIEFAITLPRTLHTRHGWDRWILRQGLEGWLPPLLLWRHSTQHWGGSTLHHWQQARPTVREYLLDNRRLLNDYFDTGKLERALTYRVQPDSNWDEQLWRIAALWRVLSTCLWLESLHRRNRQDPPPPSTFPGNAK